MTNVELNHIYLVTDKETYSAIKESEIVRNLAFTYEQKNTADAQTGWEGFYIRGKHTFIELFYPQERYPSTGISGIGMGIDTKGGIDNILEKLKKDFPNAEKGFFKRNGRPWFEYVAVNGSYFFDKHSYWIMEYSSEYFSENPENVSRKHYNTKNYDPMKPFLDIKGFSIALKSEALQILSSQFKASGLKIEKNNVYRTSENVEIGLVEEDKRYKGIYKIDFILNTSLKSETFSLGNSKLTVEDKQGSWTFLQCWT